MEYFNPVSALIEGTGALFNSSKRRYTWRFVLDSQEHSVELECSYITNKRRVTFDGSLIFKGTKPLGKDFQYRFQHEKHIITVENRKNDANLHVDSLSFNEIYGKKIWEKTHSLKAQQDSISNIKDPRPARYISEDEYNVAIKISEPIIQEQKKSLHEILYKDSERSRPKHKISDNFLDIEKDQVQVDNDLLGFSEPKKTNDNDLLGFSNEERKEVRNPNINEEFLSLHNNKSEDLRFFSENPPKSDLGFFPSEKPMKKDLGLFPDSPAKKDLNIFSENIPKPGLGLFADNPPKQDLNFFTATPPIQNLGLFSSVPPNQDISLFSTAPPNQDIGLFSDTLSKINQKEKKTVQVIKSTPALDKFLAEDDEYSNEDEDPRTNSKTHQNIDIFAESGVLPKDPLEILEKCNEALKQQHSQKTLDLFSSQPSQDLNIFSVPKGKNEAFTDFFTDTPTNYPTFSDASKQGLFIFSDQHNENPNPQLVKNNFVDPSSKQLDVFGFPASVPDKNQNFSMFSLSTSEKNPQKDDFSLFKSQPSSRDVNLFETPSVNAFAQVIPQPISKKQPNKDFDSLFS
ncbi:hypothetical protein SteCoe_17443 [Stentor coeruleus]|uniref:Uncharacterized protein n=1 Tax=Stentor coeruleus TaxID=5963 RepID=A0A1R2BYU8_9CILI|nr:hypothetical protein SteCoe_17443 [Stentor coeruleus]